MTIESSSPGAGWRRDLLLLGVLLFVLYGFMLGCYPLGNPDEGRYAEIPREMIETGDWVTPRLNGVKYFEKPPLVYWGGAVAMQVFGQNEWAVRLMPALCAVLGVLGTYAVGRRVYGRVAGWAAAGVLATSLLYFALGHILLLDMPVSAFMSGTLFCFILGVREAPGGLRRALFYGLYACAALATLSKGLIGFLLPGAVMFVWLLVFNQWKRLRPLYLPSGLVLFFAIAAPWHLLAAQRNPDWAHFYFVREHWLRFTTTMHGRYHPWWYFIPILLAGFIPWVGYLPQAIRSAVAGGWARRRENADAWFFVTWALVIFLFFSKSQSKLVPYILPVFPPLAVLVGAWLADVAAAGQAVRLRWGLRIFAFLCGAIGVAAVVATFKTGLIRNTAQAVALRPYAAGIAVVLLSGGALAPWLLKTRGARPALFAQAATMLAMLLLVAAAMPHLQKPGTKPMALLYASKARPGDRIFHYQDYSHDFTFYAACQVGSVDYPWFGELGLDIDAEARASGRFIDETEFRRQWSAGAGRVWLLIRKEKATPLLSDPSFRYHLQGETMKHYLVTNQP